MTPNNRVVPLRDLGTRMQEQGRIRLGIAVPNKDPKKAANPKSIDTFRFTSADEDAIRELATRYGGTARPWNNPKANPPEQWEVITNAKRIRVWLPAESLDVTYEMWTGRGMQRLCDGEFVQLVGQPAGPDGEPVQAPCVCAAKHLMQCKPHVRLRIILPDITFGGVWRLQTQGWHSAQEMPQMAAMIDTLSKAGIVEAQLVLDKATADGGSKRFVVPRLVLPFTAEQITAGSAAIGSLGPAPSPDTTPALNAAPMPGEDPLPLDVPASPPADWFDDTDEIVDAEIIEDIQETPVPGAAIDRAKSRSSNPAQTKLIIECVDLAAGMKVNADDLRHAIARTVSAGRTSSSRELSGEELGKALDRIEDAKAGRISLRLREDGTVAVGVLRSPD